MGDVVELATWCGARRPADVQEDGSIGSAADGTSVTRPRNVVRVRSVPTAWHPSLGWDGPGDPPPDIRTTAGSADDTAQGMDALTIARLDRAVSSIDRAASRIASTGGRIAPEVETELLALVGQISLGMITDAADRAERMARRLRGGASFGGSFGG
jgi:hypothetical protein